MCVVGERVAEVKYFPMQEKASACIIVVVSAQMEKESNFVCGVLWQVREENTDIADPDGCKNAANGGITPVSMYI